MSHSDSIKRQPDTSYHGPGSAKRSRTTVQQSIREELKHKMLVANRWEQIVTAIFDRGERSREHPDLVFPRSERERLDNPEISYDRLPDWHKNIVKTIKTSPTWSDMKKAFENASCEADLYAPLRDTLNLISRTIREVAPSKSAWDMTRMSWLCTPRRPIQQTQETESPTMSFDLMGAMGWNIDEMHSQPYFGNEETFTNPIQLLDVLAVIEVGFTKQYEPADPPAPTARNLSPLPSSSDYAAPFITALPMGAAFFKAPTLRGATSRSSANAADTTDDVPNEEGRIPSTHILEKDAIYYTPVNKLVQILGYLASVREAQLFRTSGIGLLIQNSQFTLVHSDPAATMISPNLDIFQDPEAFISIIIFLTQADFPALGWDPIWVNQKRSSPSYEHRAICDPRRCRDRIVHFDKVPYLVEGVISRGFSIQGRATTVITVRTIAMETATLDKYQDLVGDLIHQVVPVLPEKIKDWFIECSTRVDRFTWKTSCQPQYRVCEWKFNASGRPQGVLLIIQHASRELEIWNNPVLADLIGFEPYEQRTMISDRFCMPFGAQKSEGELISSFLEVLTRKFLLSLFSTLITYIIIHRMEKPLERGRRPPSRHLPIQYYDSSNCSSRSPDRFRLCRLCH